MWVPVECPLQWSSPSRRVGTRLWNIWIPPPVKNTACSSPWGWTCSGASYRGWLSQPGCPLSTDNINNNLAISLLLGAQDSSVPLVPVSPLGPLLPLSLLSTPSLSFCTLASWAFSRNLRHAQDLVLGIPRLECSSIYHVCLPWGSAQMSLSQWGRPRLAF